MSSRRGWTYGGRHFAETSTPLGGLRFFIGKPTRRSEWQAALSAARAASAKIVPDSVKPGSREHLDKLSSFFGI